VASLTLVTAHEDGLRCFQRASLHFARTDEPGGPPWTEAQLDRMAFDPDEVTRLVGLVPTGAYRRGDPHPHFAAGRRFSAWTYELPPAQTYVTEEAVSALLDVIEPFADGLARACTMLGLVAGVSVVIEMHGRRDGDGIQLSTAAVSYSAATVRRLARLGLSVAHDQYVLIDEPHAPSASTAPEPSA